MYIKLLSALTLSFCSALSMAATGKLLATPGVSQIEGSAGAVSSLGHNWQGMPVKTRWRVQWFL